jgi:MFS transporter, PPP family, 3-phenylpropionic acid transporter
MFRNSNLSLSHYLFFFSATSTIIMSFLPLYLKYQGLTGTEIGWLLAIGPFASLFIQPMAGYFSDKWKTVKKMIIVCVIGMILSGAWLLQLAAFLPLIVISFLFYAFMSPLGALGDSLAQKTAQQTGGSFGKIRMWGSIGFGVAALITGQVLILIGIENVLYPFLLVAVLCLLSAFFLTDAEASKKPVELLDALSLLKNGRLALFLLVITLFAVPHRVNDSYFGLYMMDMGGSELLIGWAWFLATLVEAAVFFVSAKWLAKFHELSLIILAGVLYGVRFMAFAWVDNPLFLVALHSLHGITFAIFYTAAFQYVSKIVPQHILSTAHLLFIAVFFGVSGMIGSLGGGWVMENAGGSFLYWLIGCMPLVGIGAMLLYKNKVQNANLTPEIEGL